MALQTSGAISLAQLQAEFGGVSPISLSEYYRGGAYVPATISSVSTVREPASGQNYTANATWWYIRTSGLQNPNDYTLEWGNTVLKSNAANASVNSVTIGTYTYYKGSQVGSAPYAINGTVYWYFVYYGVYRTSQQSTSQTVNTGVPSSGTVSLSNFYGARKT